VISKHILKSLKIICGHCGGSAKKTFYCDDFLNDDFRILREKNSEFFKKIFVNNILKFSYMKKKVGISISKYLKSAAKNRHANQTARAILSAPTV
jgi:hypothetical protein